MTTTRIASVLATLLAVSAPATPAVADDDAPPPAAAGDLHVDLEVDPLAYALRGYSFHVGVGWKRLRFDAGAFAMALPAQLHGNDGFDAWFAGGGVKAQAFLTAPHRGLFVDAGLGVTRREVTHVASGTTRRDLATSVGASVGYRVALPVGLYVTPWAGINLDLADGDMMIEGETFDAPRMTPFAAVHLGYRFR